MQTWLLNIHQLLSHIYVIVHYHIFIILEVFLHINIISFFIYGSLSLHLPGTWLVSLRYKRECYVLCLLTFCLPHDPTLDAPGHTDTPPRTHYSILLAISKFLYKANLIVVYLLAVHWCGSLNKQGCFGKIHGGFSSIERYCYGV